jgi:RNA polymerase sigma-70 factor (ECF subfamily)
MTEARPAAERPDEELMTLYADGDAEAFDELFRRHEARAYAYFSKRTRSPERARDLYQELFLRIHRSRDLYDPARPFVPWFFQIAHHLLIDDQRRAHRCHEVPIGDRVLRADGFACDDRLADREEICRALAELSSEERYILVSSKLEGVGYAELALRLGKTVDAVKKAASRAVQRLRASAVPAAAGADAG